MKVYESLRHTTWECKYHVVFIPNFALGVLEMSDSNAKR